MKKTKNLTRYLTRTAIIAALYTTLTLVSFVLGLSSGVIQLRLSEALCLLPLIMPEAVLGLFIGCLISNLITGCVIWDIIFGSLATLIGAVATRALAKYNLPLWIKSLPTVLSNAIIVPLVLMFAYGAEGSYLFFFTTVGLGEFLSATVLGVGLFKLISSNESVCRAMGIKNRNG